MVLNVYFFIRCLLIIFRLLRLIFIFSSIFVSEHLMLQSFRRVLQFVCSVRGLQWGLASIAAHTDTASVAPWLCSGRSDTSWIWLKPKLSTHVVKYTHIRVYIYIYIYARQSSWHPTPNIGTWSVAVWPPRRLCYRPAVFCSSATSVSLKFHYRKEISGTN
jgi:hypothetical protein